MTPFVDENSPIIDIIISREKGLCRTGQEHLLHGDSFVESGFRAALLRLMTLEKGGERNRIC